MLTDFNSIPTSNPDDVLSNSVPTSAPSFPGTMLFAEDGFWDNEKKDKKKRKKGKKGKKARKKAAKRARKRAMERQIAQANYKCGYLAAENDMLRKMIALSVGVKRGSFNDQLAADGLKLLPRGDR